MRELTIEVRNASGLHARPAALFVRSAGAHRSSIRVRNVDRGGAAVDAKSILGVMSIGVGRGHTIELVADGPDEDVAIETLREFIASGAGEPLGPTGPIADLGPTGPIAPLEPTAPTAEPGSTAPTAPIAPLEPTTLSEPEPPGPGSADG